MKSRGWQKERHFPDWYSMCLSVTERRCGVCLPRGMPKVRKNEEGNGNREGSTGGACGAISLLGCSADSFHHHNKTIFYYHPLVSPILLSSPQSSIISSGNPYTHILSSESFYIMTVKEHRSPPLSGVLISFLLSLSVFCCYYLNGRAAGEAPIETYKLKELDLDGMANDLGVSQPISLIHHIKSLNQSIKSIKSIK